MRFYQILLFMIAGVMLYSCISRVQPSSGGSRKTPDLKNGSGQASSSDVPSSPKTTKYRKGFWQPDEATLQVSLETFFKTHEAGYVFTIDSIDFPVWTAMVNVYKARNWKGIWSGEKRVRDMIALLNSAEYDGLMPQDYHPAALDAFLKKIRRDTSSENQLQIELLATASFMRYCRDMWSGKVNPRIVFPEWNYKNRVIAASDTVLWEQLIFASYDTLPGFLRPSISLYEELRSAYLHLYELEKKGEQWARMEYPGKDLKKNDTSSIVLGIKDRLYNMGLLDHEPQDSIFDADLEDGVKEFQRNQGLDSNGILDKKTFARLNFTLKEVKDIIRANMERCRWMEPDTLKEYLLVNITGYQLYYIKDRKIDYTTRIVVGKEENRTRVFQANLVNIEFNPYWTVTPNITKKEILPLLKKDPSYLDNHNMILMRGEEVVDHQELDFTTYTKDNFPFVVKQLPGNKNALGVVKFNMPNPYFIYLHDTPSKADFEKSGRAFSHGCIRVYKPLELAEYLLGKQGFSRENINNLVIKGENTVISLQTKVPVMIIYWTYYKDSKTGKTVFYKDIYGRDQLVINELNRKVVLKKNAVQETKTKELSVSQ